MIRKFVQNEKKKNNHEDAIIEEEVFFFLEEMKETLVKPSRWVYLWADEPRNNFIPYHVHIQIQTKYEKKQMIHSGLLLWASCLWSAHGIRRIQYAIKKTIFQCSSEIAIKLITDQKYHNL